MIIPRKQMQNIVEELEDTIQKNINIMDETGCIIASSDMSRIGTYHSGAQQVISQKLDELVICSHDQYAGAKNGINLPIIIEDEIVGVVGITGEKEEVQILGKIIQKMTKILIMDSYQNNQKKIMENMKNNFVFSWLFASEDSGETEETMNFRGQLLGIDINLNRVVVVLGIVHKKENEKIREAEVEQKLYDRIIKEIRRYLKQDAQHLVFQIGTKVVIFFHSSKTIEVFNVVKQITESVEKQYDCMVYCGIGTAGTNRIEIRRSYREADTACNLAMRLKNRRIKVYSDADIELLLENISKHDREMFVKRVFKDCQESDIIRWVQLLRCYSENNGSITKTAEDCFIHKNTLQYRLTKLKEMTGYDPRNIKESIPLYIAMLIYEFDHVL
ncbi:MAG: sugar diacid recognition domain-containing protein [Eubacteriales bacterium]|nr:sugar diacid recognition domain-containing protein [Eubacteriales bacterium]